MRHDAVQSLTRRRLVLAATLILALTSGTWWLVGGAVDTADAPHGDDPLAAEVPDPQEPSDPEDSPRTARREDRTQSEALRVARLQRTLEADRRELSSLKEQSESPESEYEEAESEFQKLDEQWNALRKQITELRRAGKKAAADEQLAGSQDLQEEWHAAKERFDLAIQERKTLREKAAALEKKIKQDTAALDELTGIEPPELLMALGDENQAESAKGERKEERESSKPEEPAPKEVKSASDARPQAPAEAPAREPASGNGPNLAPLARAGVPEPTEVDAHGESARDEEHDEEVAQARKEAEIRLAAARDAEHNVASVAERIAGLKENIAIEQHLLEIARAKAEQAKKSRVELDQELQEKQAEDPAAVGEVWNRITTSEQRRSEAEEEAREIQSRLDDLRGELASVQDEQITALNEAKETQAAAEAAQGKLAKLQNPFAPDNLVQWALDHGPKLLTILLATLALSLMVKLCGRQIAGAVARSGSRGTAHDRENRALTLVSVFRNASSLALIAGGSLMALDEVGVPIGPLMGGAAVVGLAVAFGAQNLIRDYFSGFMVLLEDQYGINDVVKIGDVAGSVEKITLRVTVLRDLEGALHFIPHGSITRVTNMTHGWSRAVVDATVAYHEDVDHVIDVLMEVARDLRQDAKFGPMILDGPEMLGVDNLADSAVVIKFFVKTQPLQRWPVRRELLKRVKRRFDELGIEIPFPQRTIHHCYDANDLARLGGPPSAGGEDQRQSA